jgi:branched-chain amino acid transport system substrate-binding protein
MKSRTGLLVALLFIASIPLSVAAAPPDPFVIPGVLPLTGRFAFFGQAIKASLHVVEEKVNREGGVDGRPIRFDIKDDQSSPAVAVQLTQQLIESKPAAIIGSTIGSLCGALAPLMVNGPVQYCLSPVIHPPYGSFVFSAGYSTHEQASAVLRYLKERKLTKIALIASTDATGQDGESELLAISKMPENAALSFVDQEHFNADDTTVAAQIARIKASSPDVVIVWSTGPQIGTVFRAANDSGLALPFIVNNGNTLIAELDQIKQYFPKDVIFAGFPFLAAPKRSDPSYKPVTEYLQAIRRANLPNDTFSAVAWDPALLIVSAYQKLGTNATAAQLRDYLLGIHQWAGISGVYDFKNGEGSQRGLTAADVVIVRWSPADGSWSIVSR